MLRVLLLDDSEKKIDTVKKVLLDVCGLQDQEIDIAKSVSSGRRSVAKEYYDIVLLDLVLPMYDGESPIEDGGLSFIRQISSAGETVKMPTQIIGLTEKEDAYEKEKTEFEELLFSVITCKQKDTSWISQLAQVVNFANRSKKSILKSLTTRTKYDVGIVCALPEEYKQLLAAFGGEEKWSKITIDEDVPFIFRETIITTANNNDVRIVSTMAGRPGVIPTSVVTTLLYSLFHVDTVFMTGFSAGFPSKNLKLGDILIASSIEDYASGKLVDAGGSIKLLKEMHQIEASTSLSLQMQEMIEDDETQPILMSKLKKSNLIVDERDSYQLHMSATCCGPFVVTSTEAVEELKETDRKLEGLDMEGFGLYLTSKILTGDKQKGAMWIKGVGDFANPEKADGYHKTCSFGSATILYRFIKEMM